MLSFLARSPCSVISSFEVLHAREHENVNGECLSGQSRHWTSSILLAKLPFSSHLLPYLKWFMAIIFSLLESASSSLDPKSNVFNNVQETPRAIFLSSEIDFAKKFE
jgi:hypothetical protein